MADFACTKKADLTNVPANFSLDYFKGIDISLKSRQQGFRYYSESYIHDVTMSRKEEKVNVSARCYRSQRKSEKPHSVHLDIDGVNENITYAYCSCQAGLGSSCSHVIGLALTLQQLQLLGFTQVPDTLSCTSLPQQWGRPRGNKILPEAVSKVKFCNAKLNRKRKPIQNILVDKRGQYFSHRQEAHQEKGHHRRDRKGVKAKDPHFRRLLRQALGKVKVEETDLQFLQGMTDCPIGYLATKKDCTVKTDYGEVPIGSQLATQANFFTSAESTQVGTVCGQLNLPKELHPDIKLDHSTFTFKSMNQAECEELERQTEDQSEAPLWMKERKDRLTASQFGVIMRRKKITENFIHTLIEPKPFTSAPTSYGKGQESVAVAKYIAVTKNHIHKCGLVVNPKLPFLGASPDGKVCDGGDVGLLEVKCPYSARNMSIAEAVTQIKDFFLVKHGENIQLDEGHKHFDQVQGQLVLSGLEWCDFFVFTKKDHFLQRIKLDLPFCQNMLRQLCQFYKLHIETRIPKL